MLSIFHSLSSPRPTVLAAAALLALMSPHAHADEQATLQALKQQIEDMRQQYESRLQALEQKLEQAQAQALSRQQAAHNALPPAQPDPQAQPAAVMAAPAKNMDNRFNPSMSVILSGTYASIKQDPGTWALSGFQLGSDGHGVGPGERGFNLGESEVSFRASIDPWVMGSLTLGIEDDHGVGIEEAFIQSTSLPHGLTLKGGRFFSSVGYQNEQHAHARDFVDAPFVQQAFLNGQYAQDGAQVKWVLPTLQYVELGAELGNGKAYPGADRNSNKPGATVLFARTGDDIGDSHSWRLGLSWMRTRSADRLWGGAGHDHDHGGEEHAGEEMLFSGTSRLWVVDGVWKWAPNGNASSTSFKLQGEYFWRKESGTATVLADEVLEDEGDYRSSQSGWYLQGVYQFMPKWRVGLRYDRLNQGTVRTLVEDLQPERHNPKRTSLMMDWSPSEFQRWRIQINEDRARLGIKDTQVYLQYQMSLGAHGAHSF